MSIEAIGNEKSIIDLIYGADFVVQLVILILFLASIWSWNIIISKWRLISYVTKKTQYFEKVFANNSADKIFERFKDSASAPIEQVFVSAIQKWNKIKSKDQKNIDDLSATIFVVKSKCITSLEKDISVLATIAASTPFIGLFGTVWGIMHSFQSIAAAKNTSLAIVAPGIAEALFATGIGLAAAIPALIFYNLLNAKIEKIENDLDNFSIELHSQLTNS